MEKLISKNEYMKINHIGFRKLNEMIANNELEIKGNKIVIEQKYIPIEMYEKVIRENEKLKQMINVIKEVTKDVKENI